MRKLNFYSFHKGIAEHRFDHNNSIALQNALSTQFNVIRYELIGDGSFIFHDVSINHGSILIFEYDDTKEFKIYDFGDHPSLTALLCTKTKFAGAVVGQYNPQYWDKICTSTEIRKSIVAGPYPDTVWQLGINYDAVQEFRKSQQLDTRLYWRGSLYNHGVDSRYLGVRKALELLPNYLTDSELHFGAGPLPFEHYLQESFHYELALSIGGGGGAVCGDLCFRDIEMFGLGIPLIRPKYITETSSPLIPDFHYISVDTEFDNEFRYANPELLAQKIAYKYKLVINDSDLLNHISLNARQWYLDNISYPNITNNIIKLLNL